MAEYYKNNPNIKLNQLANDIGKVPPQAIELEETVIGALMLEKGAIMEVIDILKPECFYNDTHRKIYSAILSLSQNYQPIDFLTVVEELRRHGTLEEIGGPYFIAQLTSKVASAAHIEFHARIIAQKYIQRELIRISSEIQAKAFDPASDVDDLLDFSEKQLFQIAQGVIKKESLPIDNIIKMAINQIEEAGKREDGLSGIPCGFTGLDRITNGWQRSDLVIIAARPAMGKTAFVLTMARNIAVNHQKAVAVFSLEMASVQLVNRLIIAETELPGDKLKTGKLAAHEWAQLEYKIGALSKAPLYIDDTPAISLFELRAKCRRLKMQYDIQLIIIDYLQLMVGPGDNRNVNREQEVSNISRGLKVLAKELDVPVIALSQLNRSVETRTGSKKPQLSDLRESGAIEQDADIVIFIHRPEKFGLTEDEEGNSTKGLAEIIIAKHRNGATGTVNLRFIDTMAKFADMDDFSLEPISPTEVTFSSKLNQDGFKQEFSSVKGFDLSDAPF